MQPCSRWDTTRAALRSAVPAVRTRVRAGLHMRASSCTHGGRPALARPAPTREAGQVQQGLNVQVVGRLHRGMGRELEPWTRAWQRREKAWAAARRAARRSTCLYCLGLCCVVGAPLVQPCSPEPARRAMQGLLAKAQHRALQAAPLPPHQPSQWQVLTRMSSKSTPWSTFVNSVSKALISSSLLAACAARRMYWCAS